MERHVRLQCLDLTIEAVEYGGDRWPVEKGYIVLPMGAMDALTRPGVGFTHVLPDPVVMRRAQVVNIGQTFTTPNGTEPYVKQVHAGDRATIGVRDKHKR